MHLMANAYEGTCYSVQLSSVDNKNASYLNANNYPDGCEVIAFPNMKAIRCGCYESYDEAKSKLNTLKQKHHRAIIVKSYVHRFKSKEASSVPIIESVISDGQSVMIEEAVTENYFIDSKFSVKGHMDMTAQVYLNRPDNKHSTNLTVSGQIEADFKKDNYQAVADVYVQADTYDMQSKSQQNDRSFIRIDQLYGKYNFGDDQILAGKSIRYWGALEAKNITDNFNSDDLRSDPFKSDKLGSWNVSYSHFTQSGEISLIVKLQEEDRKISNFPYVYNFFSESVNSIPFSYDKNLHTEKSSSRPSIYLKYVDSTDTQYAMDYAFIYENGYDSQRYYTYNVVPNLFSMTTNENAYLVNKFMTYDTLAIGSTLYKLEAVYTDVMNDKIISDYYHIGLGLEHTISQFHNEANLGLIAEYYKYDAFNKNKYNDLDLFEVYQNDFFLGARYSFNEGNNASIIGGGIFDMDYNEQMYYLEYEGRIADTFTMNIDYRYIDPSSDTKTLFNLMGAHQRLSIKLGYYF